MRKLLENLDHYSICHIPREENQKAGKLAKMASSDYREDTELVPIEILHSPRVDYLEVDLMLEIEQEWSHG